MAQIYTNRDHYSLSKYLQEIGKIPMITPDEEVDLTQKIKLGDLQALEKLTKANLRFVVSVAKQYQNQGLFLPDLINEGNLGLIKAAKRFDETRGFKFISYAVWRIRQSILQALAEQSRIVRLPLNITTHLSRISTVDRELEQEYNRAATSDEIAEALDEERETIEKMRIYALKSSSLDKPIVSDDPNEGTYMDLIGTEEDESTDHGLSIESLKQEITRALSVILKQRERDIIKYYYGIGEIHGIPVDENGITLEEIGRKLGLTRERVRQIKEKAIKDLKKSNRAKYLKQFLG
ncbi:MAG: RNA polymerase sigma factor RpoD/SigA [Candidatus Absconditabacterales bacterium]